MSILSATILLILVMDPLGNLPVVTVVMQDIPAKRRFRVLLRELLAALVVLMIFLLAGEHLLAVLHISKPALGISGGIILLLISLRMVFPIPGHGLYESAGNEPFIVPVAVPLIAGPSTMTVLLILASTYPGRLLDWVIALLTAWLGGGAILLLSGFLQRILGEKGLRAVERLMGMILIVIAVQMFLDGLGQFLQGQSPPAAG
ncbi:MAG: hypothetical protein K8S55_10330 [Phycisphaerae bacterium]|nr:hypothetical protein [Phycisphaerae bacterium]